MSRHHVESPERMTRGTFAWLAAVTLLAAGLRLYHLGSESIWYDEGHTLALAEHVRNPASLLDYSTNIEAPVLAVMVWAWQAVFKQFTDYPVISPANDFMLRLLPCGFSIAAVLMLFVLGRRLFRDTRAALLAAFFCAISPFQVYYAQELRVYSAYLLFALIAAWFLLRATEEERHLDFIALAAFEVLMMWSQVFSVWAIFCFNLYFLTVLPWKRHLFWRWTIYQAVVMVLIIPMLLMARHMDYEMSHKNTEWFPRPTWKTPVYTFKDFFAGWGAHAGAYWLLFGAAVVFCAIGIYALRARPRAAGFLLINLFVPLAACTIIWRVHAYSFYEHRLFIFSGAMACLAAGMGLRMLPGRARVAGIVLVAGATVPLLSDTYAGVINPNDIQVQGVQNKVDIRSASAYISERWQEGDMIAHTGIFTLCPMQYYLKVPQVHIVETQQMVDDFPLGSGNEPLFRNYGLLPKRYDLVVARYDRIWLVEPDLNKRVFWCAPLHEQIGKLMHQADMKPCDGLTVYLFTREPEAPMDEANHE